MIMNRDNVDFIQDACNPVAVAITLATWCQEVAKTQGNQNIKDNELLLATLGKLCSLFNLDHDGDRAYKYLDQPETPRNRMDLVGCPGTNSTDYYDTHDRHRP